jgi:2,3-bisphosphoglycerate-independent phosphoglycerate mutase
MGRADLKKEAIERIDELILGPMLAGLSKMGEFRLLLQPDHATPSKIKTHSSEAVPFAIVSNKTLGNVGAKARRYTEADGKATGTSLTDGYRLIETLFNRSGGVVEAS